MVLPLLLDELEEELLDELEDELEDELLLLPPKLIVKLPLPWLQSSPTIMQ
jgi:hypothetical protein